MIVWRGLRAFARFWVDFVVGDDWTVAAAVAVGLAATAGLVALGVPAWWLLPVVVVAATVGSLWRSEGRSG